MSPDDTMLSYDSLQASLHVALERSVVDSASLFVNGIWLEQYTDAMEAFSADRDDVSVCKLAGLLVVSQFELCVVIHNNVA